MRVGAGHNALGLKDSTSAGPAHEVGELLEHIVVPLSQISRTSDVDARGAVVNITEQKFFSVALATTPVQRA